MNKRNWVKRQLQGILLSKRSRMIFTSSLRLVIFVLETSCNVIRVRSCKLVRILRIFEIFFIQNCVFLFYAR